MNALITKCQTMLSEFTKDHEQQKEIIRRFDEVITAKVNKDTLYNF